MKGIYQAVGLTIRSIEIIKAIGNNRPMGKRIPKNQFLIQLWFYFSSLHYVEKQMCWSEVDKHFKKGLCNELTHLQAIKGIRDVTLGLSYTSR